MSISHHRRLVQALEPRRLLSFTPIDGEQLVAADPLNTAVDVAVSVDGSYVVATEVGHGDLRRVTAFRYTADGVAAGPPITLYTYAQSGPVLHPAQVSVAMDVDGDAVVTYAVDDAADGGIFFNRISRTGVVARTVKVAAGQDRSVHSPTVDMNDAGAIFLGWIANVAAGDDRAMVRAYTADGAPRADAFVVATSAGYAGVGTLTGMDISATPTGYAGIDAVFGVAREESFDNGPTTYDIAYGRVTSSGLESTIRDIEGPNQHLGVDVAVQGDGSALIGYIERDPQDLSSRTVKALPTGAYDGGPAGPAFELAGSLDGTARAVTLQRVVVSGYAAAFTLTAGSTDTMYFTQIKPSGEVIEPVAAETEPAFGTQPSVSDGKFVPAIGVDAEGDVVLAYAERSTPAVRVRRLRDDAIRGAYVQGSELVVLGTLGPDVITVNRVGATLVAHTFSRDFTFESAGVQSLVVVGRDGNDNIVNATELPSTIPGGGGDDTIWGGTGIDVLTGDEGSDSLRGGDGYDELFGGDGRDTLHGGDGVDTLIGNSRTDVLLFGEEIGLSLPVPREAGVELRGSELFVNGSDSAELIIVETVREKVFVNIGGVVQAFRSADVQQLSINGFGGDDDIVNATALPTTIHGGDGKDTIWGGIGADSIRGQGGEDRLHGGDGNDLLFGDTANDTLHGGDGADTLWGGTGADEMLFGEILDGVSAV